MSGVKSGKLLVFVFFGFFLPKIKEFKNVTRASKST